MLIADIYARNVADKRKRRHCSYSPMAYNSGGEKMCTQINGIQDSASKERRPRNSLKGTCSSGNEESSPWGSKPKGNLAFVQVGLQERCSRLRSPWRAAARREYLRRTRSPPSEVAGQITGWWWIGSISRKKNLGFNKALIRYQM